MVQGQDSCLFSFVTGNVLPCGFRSTTWVSPQGAEWRGSMAADRAVAALTAMEVLLLLLLAHLALRFDLPQLVALSREGELDDVCDVLHSQGIITAARRLRSSACAAIHVAAQDPN